VRALARILPAPETRITLRLVFLSALLGVCAQSVAQWQTAGPLQSYQALSPGDVLLRVAGASVRVTALRDGIVRVAVTPEGERERLASWAIDGDSRSEPTAEIADGTRSMTISTECLRIDIGKEPLRIRFLDSSGTLLTEDDPEKGMSWTGTEVRVWKSARNRERFYGFGEKSGRLERSGTHMAMWNSDTPGYTAETDPLYKSVPFFYASADGVTYGIFLDNTAWSSFDMGKEGPGEYSFGARQHTLVYYLLAGPTPRDVMARYLSLVGSTALPPRWALGYQQSRWSYTPEARVREIAESFRSRRIPCDVIYLDIDYMDGFRIFTWNAETFPNPAGLVRDLRGRGFKVAVILDPGIKVDSAYHAYQSGLRTNAFLRYPDGSLYTGEVWPGLCAFPDFTDPEARRWWGEQFRDLVRTGIRGWWTDMNEPSVFNVPTKTIDRSVMHHGLDTTVSHAIAHNVYGLEMTRATVEGLRENLPAERPFVLTRATFAGGQRYAAVWTGDNVASWEHLAIGLRMCLNLSVSGFALVGTDIGGFIGYPSGELFARWLQLGVFTPLMRAHSVINAPDKEPWAYGEEWTSVNRETIGLRYRLLPYLYTAMHQAATGGSPPLRPMYYAYPHDERFRAEERQFMCGDDLLVAPVLSAGARIRDVHLPGGTWYDFWTGTCFQGGTTITLDAPPGRIPVLARAGSVVPMQPLMQFVGERDIDTLTLRVYLLALGRDSSLFYEDDGISFDYRQGVYFRRHLAQNVEEESVTVVLGEASGTYRPPARVIQLEAYGVSFLPRTVLVNAHTYTVSDSLELPRGQLWSFDRDRQVLRGGFPDSPAETVVRIRR
jgi:alpha-glucosidase